MLYRGPTTELPKSRAVQNYFQSFTAKPLLSPMSLATLNNFNLNPSPYRIDQNCRSTTKAFLSVKYLLVNTPEILSLLNHLSLVDS